MENLLAKVLIRFFESVYNLAREISHHTQTINSSRFSSIGTLRAYLIVLISISGIFMTNESSAQVVGDYRTQQDGNWGTRNTWERLNSIGPEVWATPTVGQGTPGQNAVPGTVTILNTHDVILDQSPTNSIGNLVIGGGASGTLTVGVNATADFTLTCTGAVSISAGGSLLSRTDTDGAHTFNFQSTLVNNGTINFAAGTEQVTMTVSSTTTNNGAITFATDTGIKTFIGAVSNLATRTWTSTGITTTGNLIFRGGIANSGASFSAGGATFNTNAQAISGTTATSFANNVAVTGIVLT